MLNSIKYGCVALAAALLAACGGSSTDTSVHSTSMSRGTLAENPPLRIASANAPTLQALLGGTASGAQLLLLTGNPVCGVDFYYLKFWTVGGANEATESSGALMVPTGSAAACTGPRPIVMYAHGTQTNKAANIADITDPSNSEGGLIAAIFGAQGYIVVAPNYAGYDSSTLAYHPFLIADAAVQGHDRSRSRRRNRHCRSPRRRRPPIAASCSSPDTPRAATSRWRRTAR